MSDLTNLLGDDPEIQSLIRERASRLINEIFDQAEDDLRHGDSGARSAAYKNLLPMLMKIAQSTTSSESETERLLEEGRKILEGMQASLPTYEAFEDDDPDDLPFDDRD